MYEVANKYARTHRGGSVVKVNDYSFVWETVPDKNGKTQVIVFYESYFWKEMQKGE